MKEFNTRMVFRIPSNLALDRFKRFIEEEGIQVEYGYPYDLLFRHEAELAFFLEEGSHDIIARMTSTDKAKVIDELERRLAEGEEEWFSIDDVAIHKILLDILASHFGIENK